MERVTGTMSTTVADVRTTDVLDEILLTFTSDGSGAVTGASAYVGYRPFPAHGEIA